MHQSFRTFAIAIFLASTFSNSNAANVRIPGVVDGFQTVDKDGLVDAALVVPSLSADEVIRFELNGLFGPKERAKAGPVTTDVPGNIYIPRQREKYGWITITLEKPEFGFYTPIGKENEISALWFSVPFDLLVNAANSSTIDLLKAAKFRKAGFAGLKDWSRESKIFISLDKDLRNKGQLSWIRSVPPSNSSDVVVSFQRTPAGRWTLVGFDGNPLQALPISSVDGLTPRIKVLGLRSNFIGDEMTSAQGWFAEGGRQSKIRFKGVPSPLENVQLNGNKLKWRNPGGFGWLGIIHQPQAIAVRAKAESIFEGLFPFSKLLPTSTKNSSITWVDPGLEEYELPSNIAPSDGITLVHIGTSKEVSAPRDEDREPELFTFAQSIRTVVVK